MCEPLERRALLSGTASPLEPDLIDTQPPPPDLAITGVSVTSLLEPGWPFAAGAAVVATATVPDPEVHSRPDYFLSSDDVAGNADDVLLDPIAFDGAATWFRIPLGTPRGTYHLVAVVDRANLVEESDETNNVGISAPIDVRYPDVAVTGVYFYAGPTAPATIHVDTSNTAGLTYLTPIGVTVYLSPDPAFSPDDLTRPFTTLAYANVNQPYSSHDVSFSPLDNTPTGQFYLVAALDVSDGDPTNNVVVSATPITIAPRDVGIVAVTGVPATIPDGALLSLSLSLSYQGLVPGSALPISAYLVGPGGTRHAVSLMSPSPGYTTPADSRFAPNSPTAISLTLAGTLPPVPPATYRILFDVSTDPNPDADPSNDTYLGPEIVVFQKRFTLLSLSAPATVDFADPFQLTFTGLMVGYTGFETPIFYYLPLPDGGPIGSWFSGNTGGSAEPVEVTFTILYSHYENIPFGSYSLTPSLSWGAADGILEIADTFVPPTITVASVGPLLQLSTPTLSAPDGGDLHPGDDATLSFTITNTGQQTSPATSVSFWYYAYPFDHGPLPAVDIAPLAPGASRTLSVTRTLPANLDPGQSYTLNATLTGRAHFGDDRSDQAASSSFYLVSHPVAAPPTPEVPTSPNPPTYPWSDVGIFSVMAPTVVTAGSALRVFITPTIVQLPTGANRLSAAVNVVLIHGATDDNPNDDERTFLGTASFEDLPSGAGPQTLFTFSLPPNLAPGTYRLETHLTGPQSFFDVEQANNVFAGPTFNVILSTLTGSLKVTPSSLTLNSPARLNLSLTNPSNKPVARKYNVSYYLSDDPTFSPDDTLFSKHTIDVSLPKKQTRSYPLTAKVPANSAIGTRYLIAVADSAPKSPAHHLEFTSKPLTLRGPLLTAAVIRTDHTPTSTRITARITNAGNAPSSAKSPITLQLFPTNSTKPILTIKKSPALKPGKYIDYILTVPRTSISNFTITLLQSA